MGLDEDTSNHAKFPLPPTPSLSNLLPAKSWFEQQQIPRRQRFHGYIFTVFISSSKEFPCPKAENYFQAWLSVMKAKYVCASMGSLCVCLCVLGGGVCLLQWGGSICVHIWMAGLVLENTWPVTFNEKPMEWRQWRELASMLQLQFLSLVELQLSRQPAPQRTLLCISPIKWSEKDAAHPRRPQRAIERVGRTGITGDVTIHKATVVPGKLLN